MTLFKQWSTKFTRQVILGVFFFFVILVMALMTLEAGLTCVDSHGCLRSYCKLNNLKKEYKNIVTKSMTNNPYC